MYILFIEVLITVKNLTEKIKKATRGLQTLANIFIILLLDMLPIKCNKHILQIIQRDACNHLSNPPIQRKEIYTSNLAGFPKSLVGAF